MHRLTYSRTVKLTVSIDINDDIARVLKIRPGEIDRFLDNRHDVIFDAAKAAAGQKIAELLQAYAEEFTVGNGPQALPEP
jgi:hypothetical protein